MTFVDIALRLLLVLSLIGINAFFVTAEFALVSVRSSRIRQLVDSGDWQAEQVQSLQYRLKHLLSTTQLGITLSSLALGWIGEGTFVAIFKYFFSYLPLPYTYSLFFSHTVSIGLSFFLLVYLQIVLGEWCPKAVALQYTEKLARILAAPIRVIAEVFSPFLIILNYSTDRILEFFGISHSTYIWSKKVTPEELQIIISTEGESTGLEMEERELLNNIFALGNVVTEQLMTPRHCLTTIGKDATIADLLNIVSSTGYSRYPVRGDREEEVIGLVEFKDIALLLSRQELDYQSSIVPLIKEVDLIPESTPLNNLLSLMQVSSRKMAIVVDEFGGVAGLVTLQDIIEEILGTKSSDSYSDPFIVEMVDSSNYVLDSQISLIEFNNLFDVNLPLAQEYQTLRSFLLDQWQQVPQVGEKMTYENLEFTIVSAEVRRLGLVQCRKMPERQSE